MRILLKSKLHTYIQYIPRKRTYSSTLRESKGGRAETALLTTFDSNLSFLSASRNLQNLERERERDALFFADAIIKILGKCIKGTKRTEVKKEADIEDEEVPNSRKCVV